MTTPISPTLARARAEFEKLIKDAPPSLEGNKESLWLAELATPKGRDENGPYHGLTDWARPRNLYGKGGTVEPTGRFHRSDCACAVHQSARA